ncbi:HlyD family type I secretion periplasmic adaptor subunit [Paracraurococcus lichenis]|uniref:Membrane fusion protein (MFP) family protein n=1 Tax=Paracraurococcus lichenis TaxID=3064888 RepID=A0ABT9DW25_9PROT|nr:HlyD family type I secretion periplasmic adaptor subunit [Paracraurococcus sp. LOR1-02]MDO9708000.1 HlyD family type I secretion periplasmic adaptor subunit [Paracraurococcus sp. LOR1-02]
MNLALSLHPAAQAVLDRRLPLPLRSVFYPLGALIAGALAWSSSAQLDRVVTAPGRVVTVERPMVVQPFERGVVRAIEVVPGQRVQRGQVLATLDPTLAEAAAGELEHRHALLAVQVARLSAEMEGQAYAPAAPEAAAALEARLSAQRLAEQATRLAGFEASDRRLRTRIGSLAAQLRAQGARLAIARDVEGMRQELRARDAGTRLSLLDAQTARFDLEAQIETTRGELADAARQLEGLAAERDAYRHGWRRETAERLIEARRDLEVLAQQLAAAERRRALVVLRAPADGIVLEVGRRSVGSVVQEAETLVTLVPAATALEAEVELGPADSGHVHPGAEARVKLSALSFQRHGMLQGAVRVVDADALPSGAGQPVHHARVALDSTLLPDAPAGFRLLPGMAVSAEVKVGTRTVLSYFLEPVLRVRREGLRER